MKLQRYLDRIDYVGAIGPDLPSLTALQSAHVRAVPFENLDVLLGRPMSVQIEDAYEKIVLNNRGGWCYEQNGLFGWALNQIGFDVTRIAAAVMREQRGDASDATHLCLLVRLPGTPTKYLVDVGFGGSMIRPIVLKEAQYNQSPFQLGLQRLDGDYWRFWENPGDAVFSFDFRENAACEPLIAEKNLLQQCDPASKFVLNLIAKMRSVEQYCELKGRVFSVHKAGTIISKTMDSPEALVSILANNFRLDVPEIANLWPAISTRHEQLFAEQPSR